MINILTYKSFICCNIIRIMESKINKKLVISYFVLFFLILAGGIQDTYAYFCRDGVFANAQTGNVVLFSVNFFRGDFAFSLRYLITIVGFVIGIGVSRTIQMIVQKYNVKHWRVPIICIEVIILFIVGFINFEHNIIATSLVSFVSAMQVHTFKSINGHVFGSTMCIGNLLRASENFTTFIQSKKKSDLLKSLFYWSVIIAFGLGAGIGYLISEFMGLKTIWISSLFILISGILSIINYSE